MASGGSVLVQKKVGDRGSADPYSPLAGLDFTTLGLWYYLY